MEKVTRKLATILAADCAGYSELMDKNEELTLENLKICRSIIDPIIEEYGGRIFNTAGDSVVAEFSSTVESVNSGIVIQKTLSDRNKESDPASQLLWRIGIHLDDVIIEGDNIYLFTDGYLDQFGGEKGKKFKKTNFKKLLLSIEEKSMQEQSQIIQETFNKWKGDLEQIDDVCVMGVRIT